MKNVEDGKVLAIGTSKEESGERQNIIDPTQFDRGYSTSSLLLIS